jgi:alkanesulfonate monooxygenase SsuD/methylene tetrahydromethanopterin reductase-like flavin-dependent oxidoreductase (luciferase family)
MNQIKLGALCWNQHAEWAALLAAGIRADRLGYDTLWCWDHLYPIVGEPRGPIFEGWLTNAAWAQATSQVRIGLMVGANTFRNPAHVAKMAATLDHISGGRAILGLGGAWFEEEHRDFGIEFGSGFPERLRWLGEALPIIRGMLDGTEPTAAGPRYVSRHTRNEPAPVQAHLPILVGGGGEKVTLKLVAKYAWNIARQWAATRPRSSARPASAWSSSATIEPRRSGCSGPRSSATGSRSPGRTSRSGRRRMSPRCSRPTSLSATGTWWRASRPSTTRNR